MSLTFVGCRHCILFTQVLHRIRVFIRIPAENKTLLAPRGRLIHVAKRRWGAQNPGMRSDDLLDLFFLADRFQLLRGSLVQLGIRGPEVIEVVTAVFVGNDAVPGKQPFSVYDVWSWRSRISNKRNISPSRRFFLFGGHVLYIWGSVDILLWRVCRTAWNR